MKLARRLIRSGAVPAEEVERALYESVTIGMPFPQSLAARGSDLLQALERELAKTRVPLAHKVRVSAELAAELPLGLCERLLAVPIGRDEKSFVVDVAAVDPLDPAVASELAYHLGNRVRVFRAPLTEILLAIDAWLDERDASQSVGMRTPAFGSRAVKRPSSPPTGRLSLRPPRPLHESAAGMPVSSVDAVNPSEPPIPLVRRSIPDDFGDRFNKGTDPGVGSSSSFALIETDEAGEPVIGLYRAKLAPPPPVQVAPEERLKEAQARLDGATSPEGVVAGLVHGLEALATRTLVLSLRGRAFEGRAGSPSVGDPERLRNLRIDATQPSVLQTTAQAGYFLGPLPPTPVHDTLKQLFGDGEVYVARVDVSGRPALFFLMAGLQTAFGATRRADELAHAASRALERIVRSRKQG